VVLALALLAAPPFVSAGPATKDCGDSVSEASCCCCAPNQDHTGVATCTCDGCAQKGSQRCDCASNAFSTSALPVLADLDSPLSLSGRVAVAALRYAGRTDTPPLRPPIIS
jgi:hypothetical protein